MTLLTQPLRRLKFLEHYYPNLQSTDSRIKIIDLKRKDRDEEIDNDDPDAKKQCLNDIREN